MTRFAVWPNGRRIAVAITPMFEVRLARHRELAQWALDSEFDEITCAKRLFS